ncbi:MAG: adenine phosphoribosyltransferase [Bacteroidia bacterium]|nr:adenine phosphoribosyltransferase [Bacteroidia bacterium]
MQSPTLAQQLRGAIRVVPDFPKPGISFKDITPIWLEPQLVAGCVAGLAERFAAQGITKVVGIESRGFLLGPQLAQALGAGFVIVRKRGKLPAATVDVTYDLEYGNAALEMHRDALQKTDRVLIHDDLLATGGTASAAAKLTHELGARVAGFAFLVELESLAGRAVLSPYGVPIETLVRYAD